MSESAILKRAEKHRLSYRSSFCFAKHAMQASLLGSQDATKDFTYTKADGVSWETTAMGTTTVVKTAKQ